MRNVIRHGDHKSVRYRQQRDDVRTRAHVNDILTNPTKRELRDELAQACANTAKLPIPTEGETDASDH